MNFLIRQDGPEVADAGLGVPAVAEGPAGGDGVVLGGTGCRTQVVVQPAAVSTVAPAGPIVGAQAPRTGVENLVGIGVGDVLVEDVLRQVAVDEEELRVVVVAAEMGGHLGVELGIDDDEFLVGVAARVT